jgi:ABC-type multidrug transport system fused ATPase/permease subunit
MARVLDHKRGRGLAAVAALTLVQAGAAGAAAFATRALFEAMHGGAQLPVIPLVVLVAAGLTVAVTRIGARVLGERVGQDYARQIRAALFDHAARMPARAVAERRAGYMSLRFVGDMTAFRNWLGIGLPRLVTGAILIPAMLGVLWLLGPIFVLAVLPVIALTLLAIVLGGLRLVPLQRRLRVRRARIAAEMAERMPLAPRLDRLGRRGTELAQLRKRTDAMIRAALRHQRAAETLKALPDLAAGVAAALIILFGHREGLMPGSIAAALAVLGLLLSPLRDLGGVWNLHAAFSAARVKADAALSRGQRDLYRSGQGLPKAAVDLTFERVMLPSGRVFSHHVNAGETVTFPLGELDAEAVMDMLLGLDAPLSGRVLLSGTDLRDLSRGSLRRGVGLVNTSPEILQGSLRRVLLMGCSARLDDAALKALARTEGLGPTLDRLGGLEGTVREGGRNLTRGERLAISLMRVILLRPRLILLGSDCDLAAQRRITTYLTTHSATVVLHSALTGEVHSAA